MWKAAGWPGSLATSASVTESASWERKTQVYTEVMPLMQEPYRWYQHSIANHKNGLSTGQKLRMHLGARQCGGLCT